MKVLIFSDIHGSLPVAGRMLDLTARHNPALVILLGDALYHGPRNRLPEGYNPRETAAALAPLAPKLMAIKGNCDSEVDESLLPFPLAPLFSWLLLEKKNGAVLRVCATHGHLYNPGNLPPLAAGDVLLFGHTHVPLARINENGVGLFNPGSLALPKEGSPPCYGLYEDGLFRVLADDNGQGEEFLRLDCR